MQLLLRARPAPICRLLLRAKCLSHLKQWVACQWRAALAKDSEAMATAAVGWTEAAVLAAAGAIEQPKLLFQSLCTAIP